MTSVKIGDRRVEDLVNICLVEAGQVYRVDLPEFRYVSPCKRVNAAMTAKQMVDMVCAKLIIGEIAFSAQQAERVWPDYCKPEPGFGAY